MANLQSLTVDDTGSLTLPNGTGSNRGTINTTVATFTTVTTTTWTVPANVTSVEVLVVAGGGGGGRFGGGGGAGGVIYNPNYRVTPGQTITVTVGAGGAGHPGDAQSGGTASNGGNSRFGDLIAIGGGGGGNYNQGGATGANAGAAGGSGGGSGSNGNNVNHQLVQVPGGSPTSGQGNRGGFQSPGYGIGGGGGGGAGTGGYDGTRTEPYGGAGGHGILSTISGSPVYYGGGGGGCCGNAGTTYSGTAPGGLGGGGLGTGPGNSTSLSDGAANTGGGGGGTCDSVIGGTARAGNGGSGIVIVRYALTSAQANPLAQSRFNTQTKSLETYKGNNKWEAHNYGEKIVTNGLRFYADPKLYSGSGTLFDLSGFGNNATLNGSISHNSTVGYFDLGSSPNTTNYITIPAAAINGATEFTVNMWLYVNATNAIDTFFTCGAGNDNLFFFSGRNTLSYQNTTESLFPYPTNLGEWMLFTATGKAGVITVYKNGKFLAKRSNNSTVNVQSTLGIVLGNEMDSNSGTFETGQAFLGRYGPIALYNRALAEGEVQQNYIAQKGRFGVAAPYINLQHGAPGSSPETAAPSAREIRRVTGTTQNGFYWIKPGNQEPIWVYCDMNYDDGGWVLVMANARAGQVTGIGGTNGIGAPTYYQSINHVWYNGNVDYGARGSGINNTAGIRLRFRCLVGLRFWPSLGLNIAQFCSTDAVTLSQTASHTKRYRWGYTGFNNSFAFQGPYIVGDDGSGAGTPGLYSYHAVNGYSWTTFDQDQDAAGNNCAGNYGNVPWWYGACWSGNMYGGGNSGSYIDGPYWDGSGTDYHNYMAVYLRV